MNLAEFLQARITEDATCPVCHHPRERHVDYWCRVERDAVNKAGQRLICCCAHVTADRTVVECETKRRLVALQAENDDLRYQPGFHYKAQLIDTMLRTLAYAYADHPDYDQAWRP